MKNPQCRPQEIEWIEMTDKEFYLFVNSPESRGRHFVDMGDVVLETTEEDARSYKAEQNHHYYIQAQEDGWRTQSIYAIEGEDECSDEEVIRDDTQDVEAEAILRLERKALRAAFYQLDEESRLLIHALYLTDERKTGRDLAQERGVSQVAIHKQKKKILETIKFLVIKFQKSQQ